MRKVSRIHHSAPVDEFVPTREQDSYAEAQALRYGSSSVGEPAPEGIEGLGLGIEPGSVVIVGLTDDIERSKALVSPSGEAQVIF